jgi:Domain of unknown function (DUF6875)
MSDSPVTPPEWWLASAAADEFDASLGAALLAWLHGTVAAPAPQLGRSGALCPYLPATMRTGLLFATVVGPDNSDPLAQLRRRACEFRVQPPIGSQPGAINKALLVLFPGRLNAQVAALAAEIKLDLITAGMTCGEFYQDNDDRSARNPAVRVATSPVPLIALRYLTTHDELFLASQPQYYAAFLKWKETA